LTKYVNKKLENTDLSPQIEVESQMKLESVTVKNFEAIQSLEPFGMGHPEPLFHFKNIVIRHKKIVGSQGNHLQLRFDDPDTKTIENTSTSAIAFKKGDLDTQLQTGQTVDIVASLSANTWNGTTTPQLMVKEIIYR
jgi:single-stranded-DNA-specific exonuclease